MKLILKSISISGLNTPWQCWYPLLSCWKVIMLVFIASWALCVILFMLQHFREKKDKVDMLQLKLFFRHKVPWMSFINYKTNSANERKWPSFFFAKIAPTFTDCFRTSTYSNLFGPIFYWFSQFIDNEGIFGRANPAADVLGSRDQLIAGLWLALAATPDNLFTSGLISRCATGLYGRPRVPSGQRDSAKTRKSKWS